MKSLLLILRAAFRAPTFLPLLLALAAPALAQGPIDPDGPPGPAMKSLQDLWDEMEDVHTILDSVEMGLSGAGTSATLVEGELEPASIHSPSGMANGSLTPPAGPEVPAMRSLQELWDGLVGLKTKATHIHEAVEQTGPPQPTGWAIQYVSEASQGGSSLSYGVNGQPAIVYFNTNVELARFDGQNWNIQTAVTSTRPSLFSFFSLAFAPDGQPAFVYTDQSFKARYVAYNGTSWPVQNIADGAYPSLDFAPDGRPAMSFVLTATNFAKFDGTAWQIEAVDGQSSVSTLEYSPYGQPALAYNKSGVITYAEFDGTNWNIQSVGPGLGLSIALTFTPFGQPAIAYLGSGRIVKFAEFDGSQWQISTVDGTTQFFEPDLDLTFTVSGKPAVAYTQLGSVFSLKYAERNGATWQQETIAESPFDSFGDLSLSINPRGQPAISYRLSTDLNYAVFHAGPGG